MNISSQVYKNNKINSVILKLDFAADSIISEEQSELDDIRNKIRHILPHIRQQTGKQFSITATQSNVETSSVSATLTEFYNDDQTKTLKIVGNSMLFQYKISHYMTQINKS